MRRWMAQVGLVVVLAASAATACAASGDAGRGPATASGETGADERPGSEATGSSTSAPGRSGEPQPWSAVAATARARHGMVERTATMEVSDSGELAVPEVTTELAFDADRGIVHATIEIPVTEDSEGGTIEYVLSPGSLLMSTDWVKEECGAEWVDLTSVGTSLGSGLGGELGSLAELPMPPFDLLAEHPPVTGTESGGDTSFEIEIPAALLVSEAQLRKYPDLSEHLEGMEVPAEAYLGADGSLEVSAQAPIAEILPLDDVEILDEAQGYELVGLWRLEPSDEPLGLTVPTAGVSAEDCLEE